MAQAKWPFLWVAVALVALAALPRAMEPKDAGAVAAQTRGLEIVGQVGGASGVSRSVAVRLPYVYVGKGPRIAVYEVSDPSQPERVALSPVLPGIVRRLVFLGDHIIAASDDRSVSVLRAAGDGTVSLVASLADEIVAYGYAVGGSFVYFVDGVSLVVYDFTDPGNPLRVAQTPLSPPPLDVAIDGEYAYVVGWDELTVVDVSAPAAPRLGATVSVEMEGYYGYPRVTARDGLAVLLGSHAHILDVSDPQRPVEVGRYEPFQWATDGQIRRGHLYLAISTFADDSFSPYGGFEIVDLSDPADPAARGEMTLPDDVCAVAIESEHAYLAAGRVGLRVIDVADKDAPVEVASDTPPFGQANAIALMDGHIFVSAGGRIIAYDASETAWQEPLGEIRVENRRWSDPLVARDGYLYAGSGKGFVVVDARDPARMQPATAVSLEDNLPAMEVLGEHLYLANQSRLRIYDISDPAEPVPRASMPLREWAQDLAVVDRLAYISTYTIDPRDSRQGLLVLDVSNPLAPREVGDLELSGPLELSFLETDISVSGGFAYLGGSVVLDARDPAHPRRVLQLTRAGGRVDSSILGDRLYVAAMGQHHEGACLRVLDISDPARPSHTAALPLPDVGWGDHLAINGNLIYVAAGTGGVYVVRDTGLPDDSNSDTRCPPQEPWTPHQAFLPSCIRGH